MADESITLEQGEELQRQREREFAELDRRHRLEQERQRRLNQQRADRGRSTAANLAGGSISAQAERLWAQAWFRVHEGIEDFSFAFFGAGFLIAGPLATLLYIIRVIGAYAFGGFGHIRAPRLPDWVPVGGGATVSVPMIPRFSPGEGIYRTAKVALMAVLSFIVYGALTLILFFLFHPEELTGVFGLANLGGFLSAIVDYFGF